VERETELFIPDPAAKLLVGLFNTRNNEMIPTAIIGLEKEIGLTLLMNDQEL
jgi:hypothetical protein